MFQILKNRVYRHLLSAQILSLLGTGLTTVALSLLAFDLAGADAGVVLGTAFALKMVAYVGLSPIAGALAARFPRRAFLVVLDVIRAGLVLFLPFVSEIWHIYVLVFAFQSFSAAFTPTFQATIPDVLPDEGEYTNALSLSRLAYDLESLLSPLLAGILLTVISFHWLFVGTAIGFLASAALVLSVALPTAKAVQEGSFYRRVTWGIHIYLATPRLRGVLALYVAVAAAGAMVIVNTVVYVRELLGGSNQDVAIFLMSYGSGSMLLALALPRLLERLASRTLMAAGALLLVGTLIAVPFVGDYTTVLFLWALLGAGSSIIQTPVGLLLRRSSRGVDRPAVFSAQFALSHGCWLITYPAAGWLGASLGLDTAFGVMAAASLAGLLLALYLWPAKDPDVLYHVHEEFVHEHHGAHDEHHPPTPEGQDEQASHRHRHEPVGHAHRFVIDEHHRVWPKS